MRKIPSSAEGFRKDTSAKIEVFAGARVCAEIEVFAGTLKGLNVKFKGI